MPVRKWFTTGLLVLLWGCTVPHGIYLTVLPGQTLFRISRTYGVDERYLARINGIDDPGHLQVGDRLFIPGAKKIKPISPPPSPSVAKPARSVVAAGSPSSPRPASVGATRKNFSQTRPPPGATKIKFVWPVKGKILSRFGATASPYRKGLEIAAPPGNPVVSAAAGKVIYSGAGIRGYGNLIILKHDNSFYTVYGFNRKNLVKAGSFVSEGQEIALSGSPPDGGRPCLYFELRSGRTAVDPIFYLP
jgi:lipoprotein NlpD